MKDSERFVIISFLIIPFFIAVFFTLIPLIQMIFMSFYDMSFMTSRGFVGLENYISFFTDQTYIKSMIVSLYYIVGGLIQTVIALLISGLLCFKTKFGVFFRGIFFFPYLVNTVALGFIFLYFFSHGSVLDSILVNLGFSYGKLPFWLRDQNINNISLVLVSTWKYTGLSVILFLGLIYSLDKSIFEASSIDGANKIQQFTRIILPSIRKFVIMNFALSVVGSLSEFEIPYVVAGRGSNGTATFMIRIFELAFNNHKVGQASAFTVILTILILLLVIGLNIVGTESHNQRKKI